MNAAMRFLRLVGAIALLVGVTASAAVPAQAGTRTPPTPSGITPVMCPMPSPNVGWTNVLTAISSATGIADTGAVWAVGYAEPINVTGTPAYEGNRYGISMRFDGRAWVMVDVPYTGQATTLTAVAQTGGGDVWAVGYNATIKGDQPIVLHFTGKAWEVVPTPTKYAIVPAPVTPISLRLTGVTMMGPNMPMVTGYTTIGNQVRPIAMRFGANTGPAPGDGWDWWDLSMLRDSTQMVSITAVSPTEAWAVGTYPVPGLSGPDTRSVLVTYNGTEWALFDDMPGTFTSVAATSTQVFVVGHTDNLSVASTMALAYGKMVPIGQRIKTPNLDVDHNFLNAVIVAGGEVYAVGYAGIPTNDVEQTALVLRYNGYAYEQVSTPRVGTVDQLNGVAMGPGGTLWAVGSATKIGARTLQTRTLVLTTLCATQH